LVDVLIKKLYIIRTTTKYSGSTNPGLLNKQKDSMTRF